MQLGLAAVTEANRGDFTVRLKQKRDRGIDEIIGEVRAKIKQTEPAADIEFVQVLQDMIGDLTSAPEPVVIKMFSQDPQLLLSTDFKLVNLTDPPSEQEGIAWWFLFVRRRRF